MQRCSPECNHVKVTGDTFYQRTHEGQCGLDLGASPQLKLIQLGSQIVSAGCPVCKLHTLL